MKNVFVWMLAAILVVACVTGCSSANTEQSTAPAENATESPAAPAEAASAMSGKINVVSREDGSGTRGAFIELFGVEEKDANGEKVDNTVDTAEITNSTSVMMTTVAGDKTAIGYISLGSLNETVKAVQIDGVAPSVAAIKDGTYTISRPFNIAVKEGLSAAAQDFMSFIMSADGQAVVEGKGYIPVDNTGAYSASQASGKVVVAGSSSVTPVMEALKEAYQAVNANVQVEIQQSDSTTGMNSAKEGICDIGMASRELKDSELEAGLTPTVIAMDGIAVVVNNENATANLTKDQVKSIYTGGLTDWSEIG
ncbi:MAG: substrate-binding domain-containing protein [Candidatus Pelethousia sp.]|nr:substrate-binding domain-containing protein [Candidatus Pelethousia sp.]